jgi:hypothetical protein
VLPDMPLQMRSFTGTNQQSQEDESTGRPLISLEGCRPRSINCRFFHGSFNGVSDKPRFDGF